MCILSLLAPFRDVVRRQTFALLVLVSLLFPACRNGVFVFPAPVPQIVKVGLVAPFEGRYRYIGYDAIYAARLAVREINAAGGVGGRRLELVAYDDRGDVEMAARIARNLVVDPDVIVVLGHYRSATSAAAAPVYAEAGLSHIVLGGWVPETPGAYHLMPDPDRIASAMVSAGVEGEPGSTIIWSEGAAEAALTAALQRAAREMPLSVAGSDAGLVLNALPPTDAAERLVALRADGWTGQFVGGLDMAASAFGLVGDAAVTGVTFITPYPFPQDLEGTVGWMKAYRAVGPHVPDPGPYALPSYEAIGLVVDALEAVAGKSRALDRETVGAALAGVRHIGLLGTIRFDGRGMWEAAPLYRYRWTADGPAVQQVLTRS